ncbi:PAAR domain-containing protein [Paraburkholderia aromaticivorans]|uniref:PAAR domain-containing protein n=1 Tax=Paraburkholderia aromaticivorans TaxID=2026199 RepID=UPI001455F1E6|nr:PAAR domain-containing protein [Paraburkholderia aromaticivorans]
MARQVIVTGDALVPFGGKVVGGSEVDNLDGRKVARKGDQVNCAEHGVNPIAEGDDSTLVDDRPVALEGHRASCGCTLVSRQQTSSVA